ncbi:MAG: hypothetical protein Q8P18_30370 [Pseudomonadota bacterium]|nr:hypothetical protein [Pseudomonadota bacterium]
MLVPLLFGAALAAPPQLSLAVGPAVGGGESTRGSFVTVAPISALTVGWRFGPLDSWIGVSGSLLMAGSGDDVVPASLLQGELGIGLGGPGLGGGIYGGNGWPGAIWGLYARATLPRTDWMHRVGLESRLFFTEATNSTAVAVMVRMEPSWPGAERRRAVERAAEETAGAADGLPAVEVPAGSESPETEGSPGEVLAYPVDAPPQPAEPAPAEPAPAEPAPAEAPTPLEPGADAPAHHDEPY